MESYIIVRTADMKPVLECWSHELNGYTLKPGFACFPVARWLKIYNKAVKASGGEEPSAELIRLHIY